MKSVDLRILIFVWLTSLVGLSFFSGYQLPRAEHGIPFDPGALFITPIGIFKHLGWGEAPLRELYFLTSKRQGLFNASVLSVWLIVHTLVATSLLRRILRR